MWKYMGRDLDPKTLLPMASLITMLSTNGEDDRAMSNLRDEQWEHFGMDLTWRYPISEGNAAGGFITPVQEGILWIPYDTIDKEDGELLELKDAHLLTNEECEYLLDDLRSYADGLCNMLAEAIQIVQANNIPDDSTLVSEQTNVAEQRHSYLTIYAVIEDWASDDEPGHNEDLFTCQADALAAYHRRLAEEKANGCIYNWSEKNGFTTDEADEFYEAWLDGEYISNHYKLTLEQKLIRCDTAFAHQFTGKLTHAA